MLSVGFTNVEIIDISEQVWKPFKDFGVKRVQNPEIKKRVHPLLRKIWGTDHGVTEKLAYVIVKAKKR